MCGTVVYRCVEICCCFGVEVRHFLDDHFDDWIGCRGRTEWPPQSPDSTSCDCSLWGVLKDKVFAHLPRNVAALRAAIETEFETLHATPDFTRRVCHIIRNCCPAYIAEVVMGSIEENRYRYSTDTLAKVSVVSKLEHWKIQVLTYAIFYPGC